MKKLILLITVLGISIGCSSDSEPKAPLPDIPKELIGKWKITAGTQTTSGSDHIWVDYDSGLVYDVWYKADGTYINNSDGKTTECSEGIYNIEENYIKVKSNCSDEFFDARIIELTDSYLEIYNAYFEGEGIRYQKVEE